MSCTLPIRRYLLAFILLFFALNAYAARPAFNCQCRDANGEMRDIGAVDCLYIGGTPYMMRCEMSGNNPFWTRLNDDAGCPTA